MNPSAVLAQAFEAINRRDEEAFVALFDPEVAYFGSLTGTYTHGTSALRGVFRAAVSVVGFTAIEALETYGRNREFAVRCGLHFGPDRPRVEQVMHFRFQADGLIAGYGIFWDAADFLARRSGALEGPPPEEGKVGVETRTFLEGYFGTYTTGQLEAHQRLLHPEIRIFASLADTEVWGLAAARGIFQAAREGLGITRLGVIRTYGDAPRLAVRVSLHRAGAEGAVDTGIWILELDPDGRLRQASMLWNPLPFLSRA